MLGHGPQNAKLDGHSLLYEHPVDQMNNYYNTSSYYFWFWSWGSSVHIVTRCMSFNLFDSWQELEPEISHTTLVINILCYPDIASFIFIELYHCVRYEMLRCCNVPQLYVWAVTAVILSSAFQGIQLLC